MTVELEVTCFDPGLTGEDITTASTTTASTLPDSPAPVWAGHVTAGRGCMGNGCVWMIAVPLAAMAIIVATGIDALRSLWRGIAGYPGER